MQADHQRRQQHDVEDEEAADQVRRRELAAEERATPATVRRTGSTGRTEYDDPKAGARQQVVRQRVAGESRRPGPAAAGATPTSQLISRGRRNAPVKKTRARWTTIDAEEHERRPVVDLAHEQARPDLERQAHHRVEGGRDSAAPSIAAYGPS